MKEIKEETLDVIHQWVDISLYNHVAKEIDPHTLWKKMKNKYVPKNTQPKIFLMQKLMNLNLKEGRPISKHMDDFKGMIDQLSIANLSLNDEIQACLLLNSLLESWRLWW